MISGFSKLATVQIGSLHPSISGSTKFSHSSTWISSSIDIRIHQLNYSPNRITALTPVVVLYHYHNQIAENSFRTEYRKRISFPKQLCVRPLSILLSSFPCIFLRNCYFDWNRWCHQTRTNGPLGLMRQDITSNCRNTNLNFLLASSRPLLRHIPLFYRIIFTQTRHSLHFVVAWLHQSSLSSLVIASHRSSHQSTPYQEK